MRATTFEHGLTILAMSIFFLSRRTCMKERQKRQYLENRGKAKKNDPHAPVSMVSIICDICGKKVLFLRLQISLVKRHPQHQRKDSL